MGAAHCHSICIEFRGQLESEFASSTMWVSGLKLRSSGLAAGSLPTEPSHWFQFIDHNRIFLF